jgi:hypothetical protein
MQSSYAPMSHSLGAALAVAEYPSMIAPTANTMAGAVRATSDLMVFSFGRGRSFPALREMIASHEVLL